MRYRKQWLALLAALALLAGCGGRNDVPSPEPEPDPAPVVDTAGNEEKEPPVDNPVPTENEQPQDAAPVESDPAEAEPAEGDGAQTSGGGTAEVQPEEPAETAVDLGPEAAPEPAAADPEPEAEPAVTVPEDGAYTASVTLEGGSGRAKVESPAALWCEDGQFRAVIVWSSSNFDYMKVDGVRYDQTNTEGNSTFEIPVAAFDRKLDVIADTIAMSEPHEVEYTLFFDSSTLQKQ